MVRLIHPQLLHPSSNSSVINGYGVKRKAIARMDCEDKMLTIVSGEEDEEQLSGWPQSCVDPGEVADNSWRQNFVT